MGSKGCYDNAVAESFFATLKKELAHRRSWPTRPPRSSSTSKPSSTAPAAHSILGYLSPEQFETQNQRKTISIKIND